MCIICKYECKECKRPNFEMVNNIDTMLTYFCEPCKKMSEHYLSCRKCHYEMGSGINPCYALFNQLQLLRGSLKDKRLDKPTN